jgi:hypothetical protein
MADGLFNNVFDNGYIDAQYPILNGHRSVVGIYRPLAFMKQQGWSLPTTIDFSCFLDTAYSDAATLNAIMQRIADDLDAVLPSVKARCQYRCAEVQFPQDAYQPGRRANLGAAYKAQYADDKGQRLTAVCIWPDDGLGHFVAPAELTAHIADYLP